VNLIRKYIFWTYERGSIHYDIMVTLILLFLFVTPHFVDFKAKPVTAVPLHASEVLVKEKGSAGNDARFVYEIRIEDLHGAQTEAEIRSAVLNIIEPMAGAVTLETVTPVVDTHGKIVAYDATILR
jgi:hypothetical protein